MELASGAEGWGETSILPPLTLENQATALEAIQRAANLLIGHNATRWRCISDTLSVHFSDYPSVRAGIEMALFDALSKQWKTPLYCFFGGTQASLQTDITIPICAPPEAGRLAENYKNAGFESIKVKIGLDTSSDLERVKAIITAHPECRLILDANAAYSAEEMLQLVGSLRGAGIEPALLEQPVARDDWQGLARISNESGIPVAADESCCSPQDAIRIVSEKLAQVINIKLVKSGVVQALDIAAIARAAGLDLMIGGMVETRLAMGFSAHFAAGLGGFKWIDLDTPLLLETDPVVGGYRTEGSWYRLDTGGLGHGGVLRKKDR